MRLFVVPDYEALSKKAARSVARRIFEKPDLILALPTGDTPIGMYRELVRLYREGLLDFSQVTAFNLDEYLGIPPSHPQSFASYMHRHFWDQVNLPPENRHIPASSPAAPEAECRAYEEKIAALGGIDLAVLGIGENGHIGFNEPGTPFESRTHVATLSPETRQGEAAAFGNPDEVPEKAITMGIRTIMNARQLLLIAAGEKKALIVKKALRGPITPEVPASVLQLHPHLTVLLDAAAASLLEE